MLSVDPIEAAILRSGVQRSFESGLAAYAVASEIAEAALGRGHVAVIDSVSAVVEANHERVRAWIAEFGAGTTKRPKEPPSP